VAEILLSTSATRISAWFQRALELAGNESVDGISSVILPEGTVGGIAAAASRSPAESFLAT